MRFRLVCLLAVVTMAATQLSLNPAGAETVERPTEPRCFVPFVGADSLPVLDFENIEGEKRISIRYDDKWVTTLRNPVAEWTAPTTDMSIVAGWEIVLRPSGTRIACSSVPVIAQVDLGPDNRACTYIDGFAEGINIWGDFRGVTHVRNQEAWIARLPEESIAFFNDELGDSQGLLRHRAPGTKGYVDVPCSYEPIVPIRFTSGGDPIARPAEPSLDNASFSAALVGQTVLVENKRTGDMATYRLSFDSALTHISDDGRYLHWYREGDPNQAEAADLHELRHTSSIAAPGEAEAVVPVDAPDILAASPVDAPDMPVAAKYVRVSTNGRANGSGFSNTPIRDALRQAKPGTVFQFAPGEHRTIKVSNLRGDENNPIVITAEDHNDRPTFTDDSYTGRAGIQLSGAEHVTISNIGIRKAMWGIRLEGSSGIDIHNVTVADIGQEGIRVMKGSSYVTITDSTIKKTGRRPGKDDDGRPYALFGEGIYLGTGNDSSDEVHHVTIRRNDISQTTTEAIDIKQPVRDVEITNNTIHDIETGTSGAVVVHIEKDYSASNPNIEISYNTISNISTNSGHRDGVGIVVGSSADIIGNRITNTQHYGIRIDDGGRQGHRITANVQDNTFSNPGIRGLFQAKGKAKVNARNNQG